MSPAAPSKPPAAAGQQQRSLPITFSVGSVPSLVTLCAVQGAMEPLAGGPVKALSTGDLLPALLGRTLSLALPVLLTFVIAVPCPVLPL